MRLSRATDLVLIAFLATLGLWAAFVGDFWTAERYDGTTVLLTALLILTLFVINRSARAYERALVSVLVTMTVMWILVRVASFMAMGHSWKWDSFYFASVSDVNKTLLLLVLGVVSAAFGIRIGSAVWFTRNPRTPAVERGEAVGGLIFPIRDLLKLGYIVVVELIIFRYMYALIGYEAGAVPFASRAIDVLLNHEIAFLWIFSYAIGHWSELPRRDKVRVYVFLAVLVVAFTSKNFLVMLALLYFFALLSRRGDPILTKRLMWVVGLLVLLFAPLYVAGFRAALEEKRAGVFGQRFGLISIIDTLNEMRKEGYSFEDAGAIAGVKGMLQLGARLDSLVLLVNVDPRHGYLGAAYGVKRLVNMVVPRVQLFPDAFLPQAVAFYVAYEIHPLEEMVASYSSEALPGLGIYYRYFGEIGALAAMFLSGVVISVLYRKAVTVRGFFGPIGRVYCVYFFSQSLYGLGIDSVIGMLLYNGLPTGATFYGFLCFLRLVRRSRARRPLPTVGAARAVEMATE